MHFFLDEIVFLGHKISCRRIEACNDKVSKILAWPRPKCTTDVHAFLGLMRYITSFLLKLVVHTAVLNPLTSKKAQKGFSLWSEAHELA
jgi:hypothetical protein